MTTDDELLQRDLEEELKSFRRSGCLNRIQNASVLQELMGCVDSSTERMVSCFIQMVQFFILDKVDMELFFAVTGLLKGFEREKKVGKRYDKFYDEYYTGKKLENHKSAFQHQSNDLIDDLIKCILRVGDLRRIVRDAPEVLVLPEPQKKVIAPSRAIPRNIAPPKSRPKRSLRSRLFKFSTAKKKVIAISVNVFFEVMTFLAVLCLLLLRGHLLSTFDKIAIPISALAIIFFLNYFSHKFIADIEKNARNRRKRKLSSESLWDLVSPKIDNVGK